MSKTKTVAIIGGGLAGLSAGGLLSRKGFSVKLFEANDKVGGCCANTNVAGYHFNDGALYLALPGNGRPYTTLAYANGAGFHDGAGGPTPYPRKPRGGRTPRLARADAAHADFHQEALVPLESETHGGEDVAIFAGGPAAQLFHGVQEQSYIFHVMRAALGL